MFKIRNGTSSIEHLEENLKAASLRLSDEEYMQLTAIAELASRSGSGSDDADHRCRYFATSAGTELAGVDHGLLTSSASSAIPVDLRLK